MSEQPVRAGTKPAKPIPDSAEVEPVQVRGTFLQRSNHDKLASDKIGEELNPNACIWRLYAEEAQEYDTAMAQERNRNLDTMLLFATLFSAIVTAFLIQSTDLLEQDYSKESMQLLLALVQSQRRIEAGTPDTTLALVEIPKFVPSASTRAANILWFAALIISLGAAVVAMLAKEWLSAFTLYRTRHAHEYALKRQNRLEALKAWNMRPIIGLLPICLNAALFLFSLGLIVRLWDLDGVVAAFTTGISAVVSMVYVYFVLAGALSPTCPYKSRLSGYVRWIIPLCILKQFDSRKAAAPDEQKSVKPEEVDLLTWLLHYSSDPTLGSYVTQALAGLKSSPLGLPTFLNTEKKLEELCTTYKQNRKFLVTLFDLGAQAIDQLRMTPTGGRNELAISGGLNAARLAVAISEIYPHALTWQLCTVVEAIQAQGGATERVGGNTPTQANSPELPVQGNSIVITVTKSATREAAQTQENRSEGASVVRDSSIDAHENKTEQDSSLIIDLPSAIKITDLENVFSALDLVWAETSPALVLSAYAYLATAELKVVRHALLFSSRYKEKLPANVLTKLQSLDEEYLQERYNRALSRTALVVKASLCQLNIRGKPGSAVCCS
ncbi:hypothetical protein OPQ81_001194 [Rhizoctonia solani]|nr:hypothetical protein OPQ81_001194 [Rhizoctonia solani]